MKPTTQAFVFGAVVGVVGGYVFRHWQLTKALRQG